MNKTIIFIVSIICLCLPLSSPALEKMETELSIATVNMDEINLNYSLVNEAREKIYNSEQNLKKLIITANKEIDLIASSEKNKLSDEEKTAKRKLIQESVDKAYLSLEEQKKQYNDKINRNIELILGEIARTKKYDLIINELFSIQAENDITDIFLKELERLKNK